MKILFKYISIKKDNKIWKFNLSKYYENTTTGKYYCADTNCSARGFCRNNLDSNVLEEEKTKKI